MSMTEDDSSVVHLFTHVAARSQKRTRTTASNYSETQDTEVSWFRLIGPLAIKYMLFSVILFFFKKLFIVCLYHSKQ